MNTYIVYFDETGDDGANTKSSKQFVLTSAFMDANLWQENYILNNEKACRFVIECAGFGPL